VLPLPLLLLLAMFLLFLLRLAVSRRLPPIPLLLLLLLLPLLCADGLHAADGPGPVGRELRLLEYCPTLEVGSEIWMPSLLADDQLAAGSDPMTECYPARLDDGLSGSLLCC
jgi:hypothetical protein